MRRALAGATPLFLYFTLTLAMTWPLAAGLTRDVPGDLGDSLLNMWILGWMAESIPRLITGQMSPGDVWNANIFHPEPLALSFSEHLFGQAIQILPVYHLTKNLILSYNLLFITSFALSGFFMYRLVRDVTGNRPAAFLAGLIYAFVPFRIAQVAHIQSVSSQWMPLALWGFRRFAIGSVERGFGPGMSLAIGSAALVLQNWSCGYYLIFFAPFVGLFVLHQIFTAGRARDWKVWLAFALAGLVVAAVTWPFLSLYLEAQRVHGFERAPAEIIRFSADVYSYLTAPEALRLLGSVLNAWPKPEGELFLGFVAMALAVVALRPPAEAGGFGAKPRALARGLTIIFALIGAVLLLGVIAILLTGGFVTNIAGIPLRATNATRLLTNLAIVAGILLLVSARFRHAAMRFIASPAGLAFVSLVLAIWLSFGPLVHSRGREIDGLGLYGVLLDYVPGFAGLRVPARYAMIAALFISMLAGIGAARLRRRTVFVLCALVLVETAFVPMYVNQTWGGGGIVPPARVEPSAGAPPVYRQLALVPDNVVLTELPFGDPAWELRYVYYSTVHWKRLVNGYSGGFPQSYKVRVARLQRIAEAPDEAWTTLQEAGTTHVIVHPSAMTPEQFATTLAWLQLRGARELGRFDGDVLFGVR
jgi:hypothetical protein